MNENLFAVDRQQLAGTMAADGAGYLGWLETPAQACRAVFLAGRVGAITWDRAAWPELAYGIWADDAARPAESHRRRLTGPAEPTELTTWLQLRPSWPQLGGFSIAWPLPDLPLGLPDRIGVLVDAAVGALNSTFHAAARMAEVLAPEAPGSDARKTFIGSRATESETEIHSALSHLAHEADRHAATQGATVSQLTHAVTTLPPGGHGRFLVTITATMSPAGLH